MCKISYKDVLYSPAGSCSENNSFFRPVAHNKGVATAWLCLGRGAAHTGGPASISASGHSLMPGGQALWSRMLTSSLSSCLLAGCGSPCFETWWKHRWELALQLCYSECSGTSNFAITWERDRNAETWNILSPCWVRTPEWCLRTLQSQKFRFSRQSLRSLTVLFQILGFCLPHLLISYGHSLKWTRLHIPLDAVQGFFGQNQKQF